MPTKFMTGARPSPRHELLAAVPHIALVAPPPQFAIVPKNMNMEGNDQYGDCVSAEEAWAKGWWSTYCGLPEVMPTAAETIAFANQYGFLNGANLTDVMDVMKADGMVIGGQTYKDGGYTAVDYSNETILQSALSQGPVKVAIDHSALPPGAGNQMGWYATGGSPGQFANTDHCVGIGGYGPAAYLFGLLGVPVPGGFNPSKIYYTVYTWATMGVVDEAWIMSTVVEAWLRNPTTVGEAPAPTPGPGPAPGPAPTPGPLPARTVSYGVRIDDVNVSGVITLPAGAKTVNGTFPASASRAK